MNILYKVGYTEYFGWVAKVDKGGIFENIDQCVSQPFEQFV